MGHPLSILISSSWITSIVSPPNLKAVVVRRVVAIVAWRSSSGRCTSEQVGTQLVLTCWENDGCGRRERAQQAKRSFSGFPQPLTTSQSNPELTAIERKL